MKQGSKEKPELFWPSAVVRKLLNVTPKDSDYSADTDEDEDDVGSDSEAEEFFECGGGRNRQQGRRQPDLNDGLPRLRRRKSETFRAQYINTKEIRICAGTWNVGGKVPPDDLDIDDWIDINEPADIYVLGIQEIVPLNAGNIFGAEDSRPVSKWENIIRAMLNRIRPATTKLKGYSDPSSPTKFKPFDDFPNLEEDIILESDSDIGEEIYPLDEEPDGFDEVTSSGASDCNDGAKLDIPVEQDLQKQFFSPKRLDRLNCLRLEDCAENVEPQGSHQNEKFRRMLSGTERIGLSWPEPPLNLLSQHNILNRRTSFKSAKCLRETKSFQTYSSFKSINNDMASGIATLAELNLVSLIKRKRRSSYVRIISKQMVGIFLSIWVRRSLRRHVHNLKVSTVGVGVMGYIGNKFLGCAARLGQGVRPCFSPSSQAHTKWMFDSKGGWNTEG